MQFRARVQLSGKTATGIPVPADVLSALADLAGSPVPGALLTRSGGQVAGSLR